MRIYLRAFELSDYELISLWRHDCEILSLMSGNHYFVSAERDKKWVEQKISDDRTEIYLGICLKENDCMIGYTSINNLDLRNQKAEWGGTTIGHKDLWGKGYATEAAQLMLTYLFKEYPINKCQGRCLEEHLVTNKMLESLGFTKDGSFRDEVYKNGSFHSIALYSILKSEINLQKYYHDNI